MSANTASSRSREAWGPEGLTERRRLGTLMISMLACAAMVTSGYVVEFREREAAMWQYEEDAPTSGPGAAMTGNRRPITLPTDFGV